MKTNKENLYRFRSIIVEYFPPIKGESVACYQLRHLNNDNRVEWDEGTSMFNWIDGALHTTKMDAQLHEYLENALHLIYCLSSAWIPTKEGLNEIIQCYARDIKRLSDSITKVNNTSDADNEKIVDEEKKKYDHDHPTFKKNDDGNENSDKPQ